MKFAQVCLYNKKICGKQRGVRKLRRGAEQQPVCDYDIWQTTPF
jgi:hypothetical protein